MKDIINQVAAKLQNYAVVNSYLDIIFSNHLTNARRFVQLSDTSIQGVTGSTIARSC